MMSKLKRRSFRFSGGLTRIAIVLSAWAAGPTFGQSLNLMITNSNPNFTDADVYVSFETTSSTLTGTYGGTTPFQLIDSATYTYINATGGTGTSAQRSYWTAPLSLAQANAGSGMSFSRAPSVRAYVSLGQPLVFSGSGVDGGLLSFGSPTYTNTNDPNWNVRWDMFEFTVSDPASYGDQGDSSAINGIGIPMRMTSFIGSGTVQSVQTGTSLGTLLTELQSYQIANAGNNVSNLPTYVTTSESFTRIIGVNNGAQAGSGTSSNGLGGTAYTSSGGATIGANATFGSYVSAMASGTITTPLAMSQTAANVGNVVGTYGFTAVASAVPWVTSGSTPYNPNANFTAQWQAGTSTNSGTLTSLSTGGSGYAVQVSGTFLNQTTSVGTFNVWVPPDVVTGTAPNFIQSATLYAGTPVANFGLIYQWQASGSAAPVTYYYANDFVSAVNASTSNSGDTLIAQVFHDLAAGYNFGLIGSDPDLIDPLSGLSFNDAGSSYWTLWETMKNGGTAITTTGTWSLTGAVGTQIPQVAGLAPGQMPFYAIAQGTANGHYNQWAELVYDSSPTAYGNPYSDYLQQVDVHLLSSTGTSFNITQVQVTILPDNIAPIPEPTAAALVTIAGLILGGVEWRRRRRCRGSDGT